MKVNEDLKTIDTMYCLCNVRGTNFSLKELYERFVWAMVKHGSET